MAKLPHIVVFNPDQWRGDVLGLVGNPAALTDVESCLARNRSDAYTRILPLEFDRSPESDTGYTGWVQFPDGEIYVVNYVLDDAPKAQIRGYSLTEADFILEE